MIIDKCCYPHRCFEVQLFHGWVQLEWGALSIFSNILPYLMTFWNSVAPSKKSSNTAKNIEKKKNLKIYIGFQHDESAFYIIYLLWGSLNWFWLHYYHHQEFHYMPFVPLMKQKITKWIVFFYQKMKVATEKRWGKVESWYTYRGRMKKLVGNLVRM